MATATIIPGENTIVAEIFIAASLQRVFQAITDPSQTSQWWGQKGLYRVTEATADLRPGGKWSSVGVGADGTTFRVDGEYCRSNRRVCSSTHGFPVGPEHSRRSCAGNLNQAEARAHWSKSVMKDLPARRKPRKTTAKAGGAFSAGCLASPKRAKRWIPETDHAKRPASVPSNLRQWLRNKSAASLKRARPLEPRLFHSQYQPVLIRRTERYCQLRLNLSM